MGPRGGGKYSIRTYLERMSWDGTLCEGIWKGPQELSLGRGWGYGKIEAGKWKQGAEGLAEKRD